MAIYYVSNNGNNDNDGLSVQTAFATLTYAVSKVTEKSTINIQDGTYNVDYLINLSSKNGHITFQGKPKKTVIVVKKSHTSAKYFANTVDFINLIFKPYDSLSGDTRLISHTQDSYAVRFYNCAFVKSDNGKYPTLCYFVFHINDNNATVRKYFYNCSFMGGVAPTYGFGKTYFYNCALGHNKWYGYSNGGYVCTDCVTNATFDTNYQVSNYDGKLYGVYSGDYSWGINVLIKMNNKYYSILNDYYNIETKMYNAFDNYDDANFFLTSTLLDEVTIGDETFCPMDKFTDKVQLVVDGEVASIHLDAYKTTNELIVGAMLDLREFANINSVNTNNSIKMALCINESQWMTYDFDNGVTIPLNVNIPLNKTFEKFTPIEKNNWNEALSIIDTQGFTADKIKEIDFNQANWKTIRIAYVLDTTTCDASYEVIGSKFVNQTQDALMLFNATEIGFENTQDGFSKTCENKQLPIFSDNTSRIKTQDGVTIDWWTTTNVEVVSETTNEETGEVTTTTHTEVATISFDGTLGSSSPNVEKGLCFGFNI